MEKLKLKDLKPYIKIYKDRDFEYHFTFSALIPVLEDSNKLVPFHFKHMILKKQVENSRNLIYKRLIEAIGEEINKICIFYKAEKFQYIDEWGEPVVNIFDRNDIPYKWLGKELNIITLRKIINEYLAR